MNKMSGFFELPAFLFTPWLVIAWMIVWLVVLYLILTREDFDTLNKLLWVVVVIFVPFFGVILYWIAAPSSSAKIVSAQSGSDVSGTPWEKNPGHHE